MDTGEKNFNGFIVLCLSVAFLAAFIAVFYVTRYAGVIRDFYLSSFLKQ